MFVNPFSPDTVISSTSSSAAVSGLVAGDSSAPVAAANKTALQTALTAGGNVYIATAGTYWIDATLNIGDNTWFHAMPGTIIKTRSAVNASCLKNVNHATASSLATGNKNFVVEDIIFDGNKSGQTTNFSTVDIRYCSHFRFDRCQFNNGLRTGAYHLATQSSNGEGIVLRFCQWGYIDNCHTEYNAYDGFKPRSSSDLFFSNISGLDNGKSLIQICYDPTFSVNAVASPSKRIHVNGGSYVHTTGVPDLSSPTTSGVYLHGAEDCEINGVTVHGARQGIGGVEHMLRNTCTNLNLQTRFATDLDGTSRSAIDCEVAFNGGTVSGNYFGDVTINPVSGASGKFVTFTSGSDSNTIAGIRGSVGGGSGTWTITTASNNNLITGMNITGLSITDTGTNNFFGDKVSIVIAASDETTDLTAGTAKVTFRMPHSMFLTGVVGGLSTAATGGTLLTIDVNEGGSSILSTKLTFDASEKTTTTAATPCVISDKFLALDSEITIDIDAVGSTTAGKGLKVTLLGSRV